MCVAVSQNSCFRDRNAPPDDPSFPTIDTYAIGINKSGKIVLQWAPSISDSEQSSFYNGKTYKTIDVPGADGSFADDIDTAGDVLYAWLDSSLGAHGALFHDGKYYRFDHPKAVYTYGGGINDKNTIVGGYATVTDGPVQGFKATYK